MCAKAFRGESEARTGRHPREFVGALTRGPPDAQQHADLLFLRRALSTEQAVSTRDRQLLTSYDERAVDTPNGCTPCVERAGDTDACSVEPPEEPPPPAVEDPAPPAEEPAPPAAEEPPITETQAPATGEPPTGVLG
jgi:hypothetical protein